MPDQSSLEAALNRFERAMRTFEGSAVRTKQQLATSNTATNEAHVLREDRSRLAAELDRSKAKLADLTRINGEAVRRIDTAMAAVQKIIERETKDQE